VQVLNYVIKYVVNRKKNP